MSEQVEKTYLPYIRDYILRTRRDLTDDQMVGIAQLIDESTDYDRNWREHARALIKTNHYVNRYPAGHWMRDG